jgi:hypothetical protein
MGSIVERVIGVFLKVLILSLFAWTALGVLLAPWVFIKYLFGG